MHFIFMLSFLSLVFFDINVYAEEWERSDVPDGAEVYIITPKNGQSLTSPFVVKFGLSGMGVAPAGVEYPDTGHHHLIINAPSPNENKAISKKQLHLHKGQTEITIKLTPGKHTLQAVLGDYSHIPHDPPVMSEVITVTVE